jgi:RNA-directed DNA polymerase
MTNGTLEKAHALTASKVMVNGPEDQPTDWWSIDWRQAEEEVRRLRHRIFTASREGDLKRVRNLQKLMLRSRANAVVSVRRRVLVPQGGAPIVRVSMSNMPGPEQQLSLIGP